MIADPTPLNLDQIFAQKPNPLALQVQAVLDALPPGKVHTKYTLAAVIGVDPNTIYRLFKGHVCLAPYLIRHRQTFYYVNPKTQEQFAARLGGPDQTSSAPL